MAIRQKTVVALKITGECPSHSKSEISVRDVSAIIDEPLERGGTNLGPSPVENTVASLVACTNVIGHKCAAMLGIDIGHLKISAVCDFNRRGVMLMEEIDKPFTRISLDIEADGSATPEQLQQVSAEVAKFCPVAKLFRQAGVVVEETWSSRSGNDNNDSN